MAKLSRTKGRAFEQKIARIFRGIWPDAIVRRSSQADRAHNPDVMIEHGPALLQSLWLELQDAREPTPLLKLAQAERDIDAAQTAAINAAIAAPRQKFPYPMRSAVIIWHRLASRTINVTLRACVYDSLRGYFHAEVDRTPITLDLSDFLDILKERCAP